MSDTDTLGRITAVMAREDALDALEVAPSSLTDALSGEIDDYVGVDRNAEREAFFNRLEHTRADQ